MRSFLYKVEKTPFPLEDVLKNSEYNRLIDPFVLARLQSGKIPTKSVVIECRVQSSLIALCVVDLGMRDHFFCAKIISFCCSEKDEAYSFLDSICDFLTKEEKISSVELIFVEENVLTPSIEKFFCSRGNLHLLRFFFDVFSFVPMWLYNKFPCHHTSIFPWSELTEGDRRKINYSASQGHFLPCLNPFRDEVNIDISTSFGMRYEGNISGWCLTQRIDHQTECFTKFYVSPLLESHKYRMALLAETIKKQKTLQVPYAFFELDPYHCDPAWCRFVKKRLLPFCLKVDHQKRFEKILAN